MQQTETLTTTTKGKPLRLLKAVLLALAMTSMAMAC
jgi:hypothetical protein